jgi:hypothetical protein
MNERGATDRTPNDYDCTHFESLVFTCKSSIKLELELRIFNFCAIFIGGGGVNVSVAEE